MTKDEFAEKVLAALRELGALSSAQEVADFLAREGITGDRGWPCTCPIARFIGKRVDPNGDDLVVATVNDHSVQVDGYSSAVHLHAWIGFEQAAKDFIRAFDREGLFAELVDTGKAR